MSSFPSRFPEIHKGMTLEEYLPFKALGAQPIYYGPKGPYIGNCGCGRLFYAKEEGSRTCPCANPECAAWEKENPDEAEQLQKESRRWRFVSQMMLEVQNALDNIWYRKASPIISDYDYQMDMLSEIDCHECETKGYDYCKCNKCPSCRESGCDGYCYEEEDYDY